MLCIAPGGSSEGPSRPPGPVDPEEDLLFRAPPAPPEAIRVVATTLGTSDWRVERADGTYLCDIRIELGSYCSRYLVLRDGHFQKEGTFFRDVWDDDAVRHVLAAIVWQTSPNATVTVERPPRHEPALGDDEHDRAVAVEGLHSHPEARGGRRG
jgi:hypothetical protein